MTQDTGADAAMSRPIQGWQPSTFLERGVVVPFTTPHLAGARLRPAGRGGLEVIVPNISGARGVYILPWDGVQALCCPTLHDRRLNARLAGARAITPGTLRRVSREVAAEGLAGREAAIAATQAMAIEEQQRLTANLELLFDLVRQTEPRGAGWVAPECDGRDALERRARAALAALAPRLGRAPDALAMMLEELATLFGPIGIGRAAQAARLPSAVAALDSLIGEMRDFQRAGAEAANPDAALIDACASMTVRAAAGMLAEARTLLADLPALLRRWADDSAAVARLVGRPEWLLDGWERICLLWRCTDPRIGRATTLAEMAELVPATPREAADWAETQTEQRIDALRHRRKVQRGEDWRTGLTMQDLVARNERLRAFAPDGPA